MTSAVTNVANQVILNAGGKEKKLRLDTCVALVVVSHTVTERVVAWRRTE